MPYRDAWIAAQKPMFRLESYNFGIGVGEESKDLSQTIVDQIYCGRVQADDSNAPPRPPNAWILYRTAKLKEFKAQCPTGNIEWRDLPSTSSAGPNKDGLTPPLDTSRNTCLQAQLSRLISNMWKMEEAEVKAEYYAMAEERKRAHSTMFPHYKYRPKKKKTARQADREGEAAPIALSATSSSYLLSPSQVSPPILVTHSAKTRTEKKKLNKTKSLHSIRSKIVSPRAAAQHRHRSASPYPTPLLSPTVEALGHSYDSSPHSLVNGLSPVTPLAEADMMQRRTLVRRSHGDIMLPTPVMANIANMQTQPQERQQRHSIQIHHHYQQQQQQQEQQLYESSGVNFDYVHHKPSFDAATESGEEAQSSPTLVITPPAAPPSVFARDKQHPAATMATPHDGIIPWTGLYQADDANAPQQQQQQQQPWTHTASSPPSVGPPYFAAPDGVILHPFYQPMSNATSTDYFQDVESKTMQASLLLEQHELHNNGNSNSSIPHTTTRHSLDGAASPNSLRFTWSIMSRPISTDASFAPATASQAIPILYGGGPAGPPFSATRHAVVVPSTSALGYTSHAPLYGSNNNINITNVPPFSPGFATNALQLQFADLQMQHQQSHSPLAHPSLVPRS